jgi:hypothetical protein
MQATSSEESTAQTPKLSIENQLIETFGPPQAFFVGWQLASQSLLLTVAFVLKLLFFEDNFPGFLVTAQTAQLGIWIGLLMSGTCTH